MNYVKTIKSMFESCKCDNPKEYSKCLSNTIQYIKENVATRFLINNKQTLDKLTAISDSDITYKNMTEFCTDTRAFLDDLKENHMTKLIKFADATYEMQNGDVALESVNYRIDIVDNANKKAIRSAIGRNSAYSKLDKIIDNVYTILEFCEGDSCYSFFENTINDISNKKFNGSGDYEKSQEKYAYLVLESCASVIETGLLQSIDSLETAYKICETDKKSYNHDKKVPEYQLF